MIGTIRRHQNWLWGVVIFATIFSFVYYLSPSSRYNRFSGTSSSSAPELGSINGEAITPEQLLASQREASIFYRLNFNAWPSSEEQKKQVEEMAYQNLLVESLLKEYKISVSTDAAARFTKKLLGVPPEQAMPVDQFNRWIKDDLMGKGLLTIDDFDRFIRHQAGQEYLMDIVGMTGELITPKEAEFFYRRENEPIATKIVAFHASNYFAAAAPTETSLAEYFKKYQADYRLPDRVQINYVAFETSNYAAAADKILGTNLDEKADEAYRMQGPNAFKDESGTNLSPEAAREKIKKNMRQYVAFQEAKKAANEFLTQLTHGHDAKNPFSTSDLEKVAKAQGLTFKTTGLFDEQTGCKDLDLGARALHLLFSLRENAPDDEDRSMIYASSPLYGEQAEVVYVAGLQKRVPNELQSLAAVRDKVVKDYTEITARDMATNAGKNFAAALQAGLTQGKSFDAICAAQNLKPETLPPFAITTTNLPPGFDKPSFMQLQEAVFVLNPGQISKFTETTDGGLVAQVLERLPVDQARMEKELPFFLARMREQRQVAAFREWIFRQMQLRLIRPVPPRSSPS